MPVNISQEMRSKILEDLAKSRNVDNIVMEICEETGLDWDDVEMYVSQLAVENKDEIKFAQSPILVMFALSLFVVGMGSLFYTLFQAYLIYQASAEGFMVYLISNGSGLFWNLVLGAAMIIGSLKGMQEVWEAIFNKFGIRF